MRSGGILSILIALCVGASIGAPASAAQPRDPPSVGYQRVVVREMANSAGGTTLLRRGWWYAERPGRGFGFDKIFHKHGITNLDVVAGAVEDPDEVIDEGRGAFVRRRILVQAECDSFGCRDTDFTFIRVVIDYSPWALAPRYGQLGVLTAYCEEVPRVVRCDSWVNDLGSGQSGTARSYLGGSRHAVVRWH